MRRYALRDTKLPDGTRIPKGTKLMVSANQSWDPSLYPKPLEFDPYRFVKLREQGGQESTATFVSTSPSLLAFGHGRQACPGRFFANNELKIALVHILLKYDIKAVKGSRPDTVNCGLFYAIDPSVKIAIRRRKEEVEL